MPRTPFHLRSLHFLALSLILSSVAYTNSVLADEQLPKSISESPGEHPLSLPPPTESKAESSAKVLPAAARNGDNIAISLLGHDVKYGEFQRLYWTAGQAVAGLATPTPVLIAAGENPGPTLCLTAAVHGDEVNGVETIRRVMFNLQSERLHGTVIGVPIVNMHGFLRASRYLPDRRDLNRYFPGDPKGSTASRIAYSFFNDVIGHCDRLIDIHTGSFHRTNLTQLRVDLNRPAVAEFSKMFHDLMVLHGAGAPGTLRRAAVEAGIPAATLEAGEPLRLQLREVEHSVRGVRAVMHHLGMIDAEPENEAKQTVFYKSLWLRSELSGVFLSRVSLGENVEAGEILGTVTDPITNISSNILSTVNGQVIGMALNQMVMPGFAAFHLGVSKRAKDAIENVAPVMQDATGEQSSYISTEGNIKVSANQETSSGTSASDTEQGEASSGTAVASRGKINEVKSTATNETPADSRAADNQQMATEQILSSNLDQEEHPE